uniref:HAT C-terminal dimerisation domain-containing protein n=1 Tax=Latimeria chalumnae TaxID=7897 RepID=H3AHV9_LATCH
SSDPADWSTIDVKLRDTFAANQPGQNIGDFSASLCTYRTTKWYLTKDHFYRRKNNELLFIHSLSLSAGHVYCYICKLFLNKWSSFTSGFNDWKNSISRSCEHENTTDHHSAMLCLSSCRNTETRIDSNLVSEWQNILKCIVTAVQFLAEHGLPFCGDSVFCPKTATFLGCLELISHDPLLSDHLTKFANTGKGMPNYLSSTICDEFIQLMSDKILSIIVSKIRCSKYYSIIVESTPDLTHIDQLTIMIKYVQKNEEPMERFLKFIPIHGHYAEHLERTITLLLQELDIDLDDCHGQNYDIASNMSGKCRASGKDLKIKTLLFCSTRLLNLVGLCAAECCLAAVSFFSFIQSLYNFSASVCRWEVLTSHLEKCGNKGLTLETLSAVRWFARADDLATFIQNALTELSANNEQPKAAWHEACQLRAAMVKLETAVMTVGWGVILQRMNATSKALQELKIDLGSLSVLYDSLIDFIGQVRNDFEMYRTEAKMLTNTEVYKSRTRKRIFRELTPDVKLSKREMFIVEAHYTISDCLVLELRSRNEAYKELQSKFNSTETGLQKILRRHCPQDLKDGFPDEFCQLISLLGLEDMFPNVDICLRMYLAIPASNCSGERAFSLMKRVQKNHLRSTVKQDKLTAVLVIENSFT